VAAIFGRRIIFLKLDFHHKARRTQILLRRLLRQGYEGKEGYGGQGIAK
jgi:hypothetical protein